ncbi:MAG: thermonuclease family protein [Proteobacteria bacterium]|nr:thermonuclease family protein [Pseudomonadota bacterium]
MLRICAAVVLCLLPLAALADPSGRVRVIDADTWEVGGTKVRLFGIDAPELNQPCLLDGRAWECGVWATEQTRRAYQGARAVCAPVTTDRHGRVVARCSVGGEDVGRRMVREGWAFAFRRYSMDYDLDDKTAAVQGRGLHRGQVQDPAAFRAQRQTPPAPVPTGGCVIKGNVSSKGERIYHMPGQQHYDRTRINTGQGERWFCSEAEARAAGWRRARR